jgi:hypothetical protein
LVAAADTLAVTYRLRTPGARIVVQSRLLSERLGSVSADSLVAIMLRRDQDLGLCGAQFPEECLGPGTSWFYSFRTAVQTSADTIAVHAFLVELNLDACRTMGSKDAPSRMIIVARSSEGAWHVARLEGEGWPFLACKKELLPSVAP